MTTQADTVTNQHPEYQKFRTRAELIENVCESEVKGKGYVRYINRADASDQNKARNAEYEKGAIFFEFTGHTRRGLVGAAFRKPPQLEVPSTLEYVSEDIDGQGNSIEQQSREVVSQDVSVGRHCLFVDFPPTNGALTVAEMQAQYIRATTISINAKRVINWATVQVGGVHILGMVVIHDPKFEPDEYGFAQEVTDRYRVLRMEPTDYDRPLSERVPGAPLIYWVEIWEATDTTQQPGMAQTTKGGSFERTEVYSPTQGDGSNWSEIPFVFVGSENNDTRIDVAPLFGMANLNIGHYRNSADYEDSVFICGQPQPWASGMTESYVEAMQKLGFLGQIGSRTLFPVPEGETFGIEQAAPNALAMEAMKHKEDQAVQMGARLMVPGGAPRTAAEYEGESETEHSVLSLVVQNVSDAYTRCLNWMALYMSAPTDGIEYEINQEFTRAPADAQTITAFAALLNTGKWPEGDFWEAMRRRNLIDPEKDDETIRDELDSEGPAGPGLDLEE